MHKYVTKFLQALVFFPVMATSPIMPVLSFVGSPTAAVILPETNRPLSKAIVLNQEQLRDEKARKIDAYFAKYDLPMAGYGTKLVTAAEENDLPPYILASIAFNESTACKFIIPNTNNCFGWGHGRIKFKTVDDAIDTVAEAIAGNNPNTAHHYVNKDIEDILVTYNGNANPEYVRKVLMVMEQMEKQEPIAVSPRKLKNV